MFPLLGYLKKLISLQNTIDQLVSYAFSPRMRHLLCDRQMRVVGLPNPNQQLRLPAARAWRDVAEKALKNQGEHLKSAEPGHTIRKQYGNKSVHAGIHCECLLALHFVQSFPGVSKLSCLYCWTFLKILREHGFSFHTKGTHSKVYFPWAWPLTKSTTTSLKAAEITFLFREELEALYVKAVLHARRRARSDSTPGECVKKDDEDRSFPDLRKHPSYFPTKERNESKSPFPITYVGTTFV